MNRAEVLKHGSPEWEGPLIGELGFGHIREMLREQGDGWEVTAQSMLIKAIAELEGTAYISPEDGLVPVHRDSVRNTVVDQGAGPRKVILGWLTVAHEKHINGREVVDSIVKTSLNEPLLRPHISGITAEAVISLCWAYADPAAAVAFLNSSECSEKHKPAVYDVLRRTAASRGLQFSTTGTISTAET